MKVKTLIVALGSAFAVGAASAATISSLLFPGFQQFSDNSAEELINSPGSAVGDTKLDVGDRLRGIFTIETLEKAGFTTRLLGTAGNNELSGIFDITVVNKVSVGGPGGPFFYTFGTTASFAAEIGGPAGSMVAFYEDANAEYSRLNPTCTTTGFGGTCEGLITDGSLLWVAGYSGVGGGVGTNEGWTAFASSDDVAVIGNVPAPGNGGFFNLALSFLQNNSGVTFNKVPCTFGGTVDVCGSGSLLGTGGLATPYDSFNNVDFVVNANVIPEPSTVALAGLALLGLGVATRRRKV